MSEITIIKKAEIDVLTLNIKIKHSLLDFFHINHKFKKPKISFNSRKNDKKIF